ncbi:MAG: hypothetical protein WD356_04350 [Pseudomonadales bacterium]
MTSLARLAFVFYCLVSLSATNTNEKPKSRRANEKSAKRQEKGSRNSPALLFSQMKTVKIIR